MTLTVSVTLHGIETVYKNAVVTRKGFLISSVEFSIQHAGKRQGNISVLRYEIRVVSSDSCDCDLSFINL